jgi:uncharacterized protein (TIGR02757 family)
MNAQSLKDFLDRKVLEYNQPAFIESDPICIPHLFSRHQDIEIAAIFAAIFAWGNRTTIIAKSRVLLQLMDMAPYDFVTHHKPKDLKKLMAFKHRTFNSTDLLYFITFLRHHYLHYHSLSDAFTNWMLPGDADTTNALNGFYNYFFSLEDAPARTRKHIATPAKNATCKRLNMFLRWMVRRDHSLVDFGIWSSLAPAQLICPIDLHVARVARKFNLLERKQTDWRAALELTARLKEMDPDDPVKYDFALFGLGVLERF